MLWEWWLDLMQRTEVAYIQLRGRDYHAAVTFMPYATPDRMVALPGGAIGD